MTAAISLGGHGKFNVTRVTKMLKANKKEEATKLGVFDQFAELFRSHKKYDKLCNLYDDLHAGIDYESTAPEAQQESNLNRIVIFYRMEKLTKSDNHEQSYNFTTCLFDDGRELIFKINDKIVYDTSQNIRDTKFSANERTVFTPDSIAEIKQVVGMLDDINQSFCDKKYHITFYEVYSAIKYCKENDFTSIHTDIDNQFIGIYMRNVNDNLAEVPKFNFLEFQAKSSNEHNPDKHSIIFYKFEGEYHILIKPNIKISKYISDDGTYCPPSSFDVPLESGTQKRVKTLGIEIILSNNKELGTIKQVVTAKSRSTDPTSLVNNGYKLVMYEKVKDNVRVYCKVFVQDYLGENLWVLLSSNYFTLEQRLEIIKLHWQQVSLDMIKYNDSKLDNVLLKINKDSVRINIIDYVEKLNNYVPNRSVFMKFPVSQQTAKIRIFQFICMYYQIYQNDATYDFYDTDNMDEQRPAKMELNLLKDNPFAEPLQRAWKCELDWHQCCEIVNNILSTHLYA